MLYACCNTDSSSFLMCKAQTQYEWEEASKISDPERAICLQEDFNSCILNIYFGIRASHSLLSHCSPHMRQACCGSPCTLWSFSSLIKVVMMSLRCWLLLLVVRQSWFFGKYAIFVPEIWSGDPGNGNLKKAGLLPFSSSTCAAEEGTLPLHRASVLPPTYWESHLYFVRSLHSS